MYLACEAVIQSITASVTLHPLSISHRSLSCIIAIGLAGWLACLACQSDDFSIIHALAARTPTSKRREAKNSKFGFGGRKRLNKQNDAFSAASMDSYKGSSSRGRGRGGKGGNRPGKSRRAAARG